MPGSVDIAAPISDLSMDGAQCSNTLYMSNFPKQTTKNELYQLMTTFGKVVSVDILVRYDSPFAFISFDDMRDAVEAKHKLNKSIFKDCMVRVEYKTGKTRNPDRPDCIYRCPDLNNKENRFSQKSSLLLTKSHPYEDPHLPQQNANKNGASSQDTILEYKQKHSKNEYRTDKSIPLQNARKDSFGDQNSSDLRRQGCNEQKNVTQGYRNQQSPLLNQSHQPGHRFRALRPRDRSHSSQSKSRKESREHDKRHRGRHDRRRSGRRNSRQNQRSRDRHNREHDHRKRSPHKIGQRDFKRYSRSYSPDEQNSKDSALHYSELRPGRIGQQGELGRIKNIFQREWWKMSRRVSRLEDEIEDLKKVIHSYQKAGKAS